MFNQSFDEKLTSSKRSEDYDFCNAKTGQKFVMKWSPQNTTKYLSKNRYASPRSVSKSVPRRSRALVRYNINRSLNFDVRTRSSDNFKSPNSSTDSNRSPDGDQYLTRSAKILRALNINYSPSRIANLSKRKINKSLNFDLSPSPKKLGNLNRSPISISLSKYASPPPRIIKTPNFDRSSSESNINSARNSSVESIDENQNQTPSQRYRMVKKSLCYLTPKSDKNFGSPDSNTQSPRLRSNLKEKIDDMIGNNMTPNLQSIKRNQIMKFDDFGSSTPRNLFNDFLDSEDDERPHTPENLIKIVPESMSAIKKSHRKERVLGRLGKALDHFLSSCSSTNPNSETGPTKTPEKDQRPTTPPISSDQYASPECDVGSIKKSHKKDKCKKRSYVCHSEDDMSETGSLFNYTTEPKSPRETNSPTFEDPNDLRPKTPQVSDPENENLEVQKENEQASLENSPARQSFTPPPATSPTTIRDPTSLRPVTPENRINFLQRIMTDSIKKSHKKIKDTNRKSFFKPKLIQGDDSTDPDSTTRAVTPENTISTRLLLSQFSSVKKSHKKDKHNRMITGSMQRRKFYAHDSERSSDCDVHNSSVSSTASEVLKSETHDLSSLDGSVETNDMVTGVAALPTFNDGTDSLAIKRKNLLDNSLGTSMLMDGESGDEEFKIFTPIKKRKSLEAAPIVRRLCEETSQVEGGFREEKSVTRCITPTTSGRDLQDAGDVENFKTPVRCPVKVIVTECTPPENSESDAGGPTTPQNLSANELIIDVNSIKKSHKKDKRARRSIICGNEEKNLENVPQSSPKPSTSRTVDEEVCETKTPPNCLAAKTYLRLLQTTSIKRSHKKVRERRRFRSIVGDGEFSDDGSIFGESEKGRDNTPRKSGAEKGNDVENTGAFERGSEEDEELQTPDEEKGRYSSGTASSGYNENLSDDGSVFDSSSLCKNNNSNEKVDESPI